MGKNKKDSLGNRMKTFYEAITKYFLPRRTYTIIRVDGKAFSQFTKTMVRPFDEDFVAVMNETARYMCENIQGAKFAYVQSDEISILLTDFDTIKTDAWFDGNVQKMASISASLATAKFNQVRLMLKMNGYADGRRFVDDYLNQEYLKVNPFKLAMFDSRVFTIPMALEVKNYFLWRQQDAVRNSIQMATRAKYSHEETKNVNTDEMQEMLFQKGVNWNDYAPGLKRGRIIYRKEVDIETENGLVKRNKWIVGDCKMFSCEEGTVLDDILKLR